MLIKRTTMRHPAPATWAWALLLPLALIACPAWAQTEDPMLLYRQDGLTLRGHFQAGLNLVAEQNLFWNLADVVTPTADFDSNTEWAELYIKPGVSFERDLGDGLGFYGKASIVASGTAGTDAFDTGDTGRITLEEAYLGLRARREGDLAFDLSLGPREYVAGTGMLISNGGSSGFNRGALKLGPHRAWGLAGLARFEIPDYTGTLFYLSPNEAPDNDSDTRIAGADVRYERSAGTFAGVTVGKVLSSSAPYPQAAPGGIGVPSILPGAREGLVFASLYLRAALSGDFFVAVDLARERNKRIDLKAWAGRVQFGHTFADRPWKPELSYSYQSFSGDDPSTPALERFDPLYYEGSPSVWSTGSKSALVFINSNVNAHQLSLRLSPTARDTVTFRYAHIRANELRSPIQFGQATRLEYTDGVLNPISGVTRAHLSDDFFVEYNRVVNASTYLTAGLSVSIPRAGMDSIAGADAPFWTGGFVNVVVNY